MTTITDLAAGDGGNTVIDDLVNDMQLAGGQYVASPATLGDGKRRALRLDNTGALVVATTVALPTGAATSAKQDTGNTSLATIAGTLPMTNAQFLANLRTTPTFSTVASAAASTQLLAANANRKGLIIVNTDANILYIDISGGTAATTQYAKALATGEQWECPFAPVTAITGIWAADGAGSALITELA